jgi:hypothetical protein
MIYFKKKLRTSDFSGLMSFIVCDNIQLNTETDYFLGIHLTSSAFKSRDNFRAKTKR